jgi:hypothetical protein
VCSPSPVKLIHRKVRASCCKPDSMSILRAEIGRVQRFCCRNRMVGPPSSWSLETKEELRDGPQPRSVRGRPRETWFSYASSKTHTRTTANRDSPECLPNPNAHLSGTRRTRNSPVLRQRWSAPR